MTQIIPADDAGIAQAARILQDGGLVAFPTETVYGLGANALNADAVARIFAAKGRPAQNPVIVHISELSELTQLAEDQEGLKKLMAHFWPGPLTLVLPRKPIVPDIVTAGGPTVAVRMPRHPVALQLIQAAGVPLAAPSANRSEQVSPTRASHVAESLGDRIDLILDGGPTEVGLESTVLDLCEWPPRLLRPGMITSDEIASALGLKALATVAVRTDDGPMRAPGQMPRHYAPRTPVVLSETPWSLALTFKLPVAVMARTQPTQPLTASIHVEQMPTDPKQYATALYDTLHRLDALGVAQIIVETLSESEEWLAIRDRLQRAAAN